MVVIFPSVVVVITHELLPTPAGQDVSSGVPKFVTSFDPKSFEHSVAFLGVFPVSLVGFTCGVKNGAPKNPETLDERALTRRLAPLTP